MSVVVTHDLRTNYEAEGAPVRALRGVDLTIAFGEFVAVMGPSGCGKSTLLNLIAGLDTPTDGEISVAGESLAGKDENDLARMRRKHIGIVLQFFNLLEGMSVSAPSEAACGSSLRRARERRCRAPFRCPDATGDRGKSVRNRCATTGRRAIPTSR